MSAGPRAHDRSGFLGALLLATAAIQLVVFRDAVGEHRDRREIQKLSPARLAGRTCRLAEDPGLPRGQARLAFQMKPAALVAQARPCAQRRNAGQRLVRVAQLAAHTVGAQLAPPPARQPQVRVRLEPLQQAVCGEEVD